MPVLKCLSAEFQLQNSTAVWSVLAQAPAIPTLKELNINKCIMKMEDFTTFVRKHCASWIRLSIKNLRLWNSTREENGDLYEILSQAPNIEDYNQSYLYFGNGGDQVELLDLGGEVSYPLLDDQEDEDGFVNIYQTSWIL